MGPMGVTRSPILESSSDCLIASRPALVVVRLRLALLRDTIASKPRVHLPFSSPSISLRCIDLVCTRCSSTVVMQFQTEDIIALLYPLRLS